MSQRLRILHLITTLGPGGAEAMLAKLIAATPDFAHGVISLDRQTDMEHAVRQAGAMVTILGLSSPLTFPSRLLRLRRAATAFRPDLIHSWLWHADLAATGLRLALRPRLPLVWSLRCSGMELMHYRLSTRLVLSALAPLSRLPEVVIANSEAGLQWHLARGYRPRRTLVIPNGFDLESFRPDPAARARLLTALNWPEETILVGLIARVDPMKDHATFFAALARTAEPVRAVLIGRGTDTLAIPPDLRSRLAALGQRSDVSALLPGLDILCLSSRFGEGFPNVLGEAMACAVPCIATDVGDCARVLGPAGIVVPPGDAFALAEAITALATDPARRRALGQAGRERVETLFSLRTIADTYRTLWRDLTKASCGPA